MLMSVAEGAGTLNGTRLKKGDHLILPMNTMEVLTLLLVVFAALSYIDRHGDDNNKKK